MTVSAALAHLQNALKGTLITADLLGREPGAYVPVRREAIEALLDADCARPMGVIESEAKRAGSSGPPAAEGCES